MKETDMMTSSNGNIFHVTGHLCGDFTGHRWITHTKASAAELWCLRWSFDVFFDLCLNKRLSKQWWGWWIEMPWCPFWLHRNEMLRWWYLLIVTIYIWYKILFFKFQYIFFVTGLASNFQWRRILTTFWMLRLQCCSMAFPDFLMLNFFYQKWNG